MYVVKQFSELNLFIFQQKFVRFILNKESTSHLVSLFASLFSVKYMNLLVHLLSQKKLCNFSWIDVQTSHINCLQLLNYAKSFQIILDKRKKKKVQQIIPVARLVILFRLTILPFFFMYYSLLLDLIIFSV